jgi:hypothetical protein
MMKERGRLGLPLGAAVAVLSTGAAPAATQTYVGNNFSPGSSLLGALETEGRAGGDGSIDLLGTSAVPEPSTWAVLLAGFAGLGFAGWRRGRGHVAAV